MALTLKKVLISDEVDPQCVEILRQNGVDAVLNTKLSKEQLLAEIPVSRESQEKVDSFSTCRPAHGLS